MKFTVLSHAGLLVENNNSSLLIDPWLIGSCYWRSWWNFPEPSEQLVRSLKPDFIYLTHLHWDHFQGPSLKLFDKKTTFLVPKANTKRMVKDLNDLGFKNIIEIPHGKRFKLASHLSIYTYQFGLCLDSAIVVSDGHTTLLNANDTKLFGLPLRQVINQHPKIDFVFRSHSSASGLPYCVSDYPKRFSDVRTSQSYAEEFSRFAFAVGARYAIPFASNHCFLHKDTLVFNNTSTSPTYVADVHNRTAMDFNIASEAIVMPPGSSWSRNKGFEIVNFDYDKKDDYIKYLEKKYAEKLSQQYDKEAKAVADFKSFRKYFEDFFDAIPNILLRICGQSMAFKVEDLKGTRFFIIDFRKHLILEEKESPDGIIVIQTPSLILNDCTRKKMFSTWTASKRLRINIPDHFSLKPLYAFFNLLDLYENDYFPVRKNFSFRSLSVRLRRWREPYEAIRLAVKLLVFPNKFASKDLLPSPQPQKLL